jgi:hypothetical protein
MIRRGDELEFDVFFERVIAVNLSARCACAPRLASD